MTRLKPFQVSYRFKRRGVRASGGREFSLSYRVMVEAVNFATNVRKKSFIFFSCVCSATLQLLIHQWKERCRQSITRWKGWTCLLQRAADSSSGFQVRMGHDHLQGSERKKKKEQTAGLELFFHPSSFIPLSNSWVSCMNWTYPSPTTRNPDSSLLFLSCTINEVFESHRWLWDDCESLWEILRFLCWWDFHGWMMKNVKCDSTRETNMKKKKIWQVEATGTQ